MHRFWIGVTATVAVAVVAVTLVMASVHNDSAPTQAVNGADPRVANESGESFTIRLGGYVSPMSPEQLVYRADAALEGDVVAISQARWSTPSGQPPDGWKRGQRLSRPEVIYRTATIRVSGEIYGDTGEELRLAILGGAAEGATMLVEDAPMPNVSVGDHVLVFISRPNADWRLGAETMGLLQGYLVSDGQASTPDAAPIAVGELKARVSAELARRAAGATEPSR